MDAVSTSNPQLTTPPSLSLSLSLSTHCYMEALELRAVLLVALLFLGAMWAPPPMVAEAAVFTLKNNCPYTVWPGTQAGSAGALADGGLELAPGATAPLPAPTGWSGRFWARTACRFVSSSSASPPGNPACATGDCPGGLHCTGGGAPPVSLAEFTLDGHDGRDFYDVSLVDGYNVGIGIMPTATATAPAAGGMKCQYAGCVADLNARCPAELRVAGSSGEAVACRSACAAFGSPEYCCTGAHDRPDTCRPTRYSQLFKSACPAAYSYAYDDATSTFTCPAGATDYLITFCPSGDAAARTSLKQHKH